jgi:hypothetical protein
MQIFLCFIAGIDLEHLLLNDDAAVREEVICASFVGRIASLQQDIDILETVEGCHELLKSFLQIRCHFTIYT